MATRKKTAAKTAARKAVAGDGCPACKAREAPAGSAIETIHPEVCKHCGRRFTATNDPRPPLTESSLPARATRKTQRKGRQR